ncbi:MAG: aspartyl protease family protein, partial [Treponema sp.]|nr:aspartyl protease family protein [Treponema sp.]
MGTFMEEITLENCTDRGAAIRGYINESQIRNLKVDAIPDTGAWTLVINEEIRQKLGLTIKSEVRSTLADGKTSNYPITEAVSIQWKNRNTELPAVV